MEKTEKGVVVPSDFGWSDIGSWKSLYDFLPKNHDGNVIDGDVMVKNTDNCLIMSYDRFIAANNISHMVVVETPDSVFVSDMESSRDVKSIVEKLKEKGRREYHKHKTMYYPWGTLTVLEVKDDFRVARLVVDSGSKIEFKTDVSVVTYLIVINGSAKTTVEGESGRLSQGQSMMLSENKRMVLENLGEDTLKIIEVKLGIA